MSLQDRDYMRAKPPARPARRAAAGPSWTERIRFWWWRMRRSLWGRLGLALVAALWTADAPAAVNPDLVPTFRWRARVTASGGEAVKPDESFPVTLLKVGAVSTGGTWSAWRAFDREQAGISVGPHSYPNDHMRGFPVVLRFGYGRIKAPAVVAAELVFDEAPDAPVPLAGDLSSGSLGVLVWRDNGAPRAATMRDYNRRYWEVFEKAAVPPEHRPRLFPIADRYIHGDGDWKGLEEGVAALGMGGFSSLMMGASAKNLELLKKTGLSRFSWAVYSPPGYAFDYGGITEAKLDEFAGALANPYKEAGFAVEDMALFTLSDEPGWYYPAMFRSLTNNAAGLVRFRDYLKRQGLAPRDVGVRRWEDVWPRGRSGADKLEDKRLFYWTMRFFAWDSARHFAAATRALERAFYTNMPVIVNWNFFSGRLYVPGPVANNGAKDDPDAAMGGHDWLEFGRLRGCTMLWTEDWFRDSQAPQWSWYAARLREGARLGGVSFGGYVIPRTAGDRTDGVLQKILAITGCGGKAIKYFVFGPEYVFPGNCYSENVKVLPKMAEAHRLIGKAEDLLWPGAMARSPVGLVIPRSALMWDAKDERIPKAIQDATNTDLNRSTVDYMAELYNLYRALQHANIPADVVDEDDLTDVGLKPFRVLYVTAPDLPAEGQAALVRWVRAGGVLVTVSGTGAGDRYHEPCAVLARGLGYTEKAPPRLLVGNVKSLEPAGRGTGPGGAFTAYGARSEIASFKGEAVATFEDGRPAVIRQTVGKGRSVRFAWFPGLTYAREQDGTADGLPTGWNLLLRQWITDPVREAGVTPPVRVDRPMVETPMLVSEKGAAITLLNWSGEPVESLRIEADAGFVPGRVESARLGELAFETGPGGTVRFAAPLGAADIILIRRP